MNHCDAITVVIADDDDHVREALGQLISSHERLVLLGSADSGDGAADLCAKHQPTLAVVDVMMPQGGAVAIAAIRRVTPATKVVVYTARSDRRTQRRMTEAGAVSVLIKGGGLDVVEELVRVGDGPTAECGQLRV